MNEQLERYLRGRRFDDPLLSQVLGLVPLIEMFSRGQSATRFFVSEFVANGEQSYGSLWVFTRSWHIEAKNFSRPKKGLEIDSAYGGKGVEFVQLTQNENADGEKTAAVHYHVGGQHAELTGVGSSADELLELLENFLLPEQLRYTGEADSTEASASIEFLQSD